MILRETILRLLSIHLYKRARSFIKTTVTLMYVSFYIYAGYIIWISDNKYLQDRYVKDGMASMGYLLSIWVTAAETIFFCSYSAIDALEMYYSFYEKSETADLLRYYQRIVANYILFSIIFPLSMVVAILFWGFYFWERELIYPPVMDEIVPQYANHLMHTYPVPLSVLYMYTEIENEPPKLEALLLLTIALSIYTFLFFWKSYNCGQWIYPVLNELTPSQTNWVLTSGFTCSYGFFFVGYYIYGKIKGVRLYLNAKLKTLMSH